MHIYFKINSDSKDILYHNFLNIIHLFVNAGLLRFSCNFGLKLKKFSNDDHSDLYVDFLVNGFILPLCDAINK